MKRIDLHNGDTLYKRGGREVSDLQSEIESFMAGGGWLLINDGEGARRDAYLWVTAGVPIALIPIPDELPA